MPDTTRPDSGLEWKAVLAIPTMLALLCLATVLSIDPAGAQEPGPSRPVELQRPVHGTAAVDALGDRLDEVAASNELTASALKRVLRTDDTAWLDRGGKLHYIDDAIPPKSARTPSAEGPYPYSQTFLLHSRASSNRRIYLDFNGHTVTGTAWNSSYGVSTSPHPAFDTDGNPGTFSNAEQDLIQGVFQRVAEDFAPFDVDVTTQEPPASDIVRTNAADVRFGTRALISPSTQAQGAICPGGCGGVAFIGVYDEVEPNHSFYQPAWVFPHQLGNDEKNIAEATTHEVGHNIGLNHDGTSSVGYYAGHGAWAPIMGVGYDRPISQWSRGEYTGANNTEDDLAVAQSNGLPLVPDDHGNTTGTATSIGSGGAGSTLNGSGIIRPGNDLDHFSFAQTCSGITSIVINPAPRSPNLDIRLRVYNSGGTLLADTDPTSSYVNRDVAAGLAASTGVNVASGTYIVSVDGVGALNPATTGYSEYGSLGAFTVQVKPCSAGSISGVVNDSDGNPQRGALVTVVGSGLPPVSTNASGAYSFSGVTFGTYTVQAQRICKTSQSQSVTVNGAETVNFSLSAATDCQFPTFSWVNGSTVLPLTGDDASTTVTLPFSYTHYGTAYSSAHISTNGNVNFLAPNTVFSNTAIPNAAAPNAAIYGFWDDLLVDASSSVRTATVGTAPNRRFVIEWLNVQLLSDVARRLDFEIILSENGGRIVYQYRGVDAGTAETGTSATVGKENAAGDGATQLNFNQGLIYDLLAVAPK